MPLRLCCPQEVWDLVPTPPPSLVDWRVLALVQNSERKGCSSTFGIERGNHTDEA
jgi:hypothetical protein